MYKKIKINKTTIKIYKNKEKKYKTIIMIDDSKIIFL